MPKDYKPPRDAADTFARYKAHYEGERALKPEMLEFADRELKAGATVGQLAAWTGLTPEVFRRRARALGVERKRPPTVGKLSAAAPEPVAPVPAEEPKRAPTSKPRRRAEPEPRDGRPLTDEEAEALAQLALSRANDVQRKGLEQDAERFEGSSQKNYVTVSSAMSMGLLTHDEVYAEPVRPAGSEETTG
jgi:hypothetical protein